MKATAVAHPIQGVVKYHGLRDDELRIPYHDSVSVCTAPSHTRTTVEFGYEEDSFTVDGEELVEGVERAQRILDKVREQTGVSSGARVVSENSFPSNVGLGASSSGFAALAYAALEATDGDTSVRNASAVARRGATSAARSVAGGFARLHTSDKDDRCYAERLDDGFGDELRIVVGLVPEHKHTAKAHEEAEASHMFDARLAHVHGALAESERVIADGDFEATFSLAERDSLSLLATTMTGPANWFYWKPQTVALLELARDLRNDGVPVYFSTDTGATAYLNTTVAHADRVAEAVESLGVGSHIWEVGGSARTSEEPLF
ncbi:diphosphomevalonate decarboxylase [Haladaptatus sp. F3-133]|jgi:phosphomevalonate decarboxylase|uniref:Diphosphomevalonate decarboxylase n=1 Tax=Halorutilus salinus TaxID=2487751 RepID=A0A9Q4GFU5_9EURY|nr:diphosphomevalonate decarboxylase [Halorutilus salinus]MCX2818509.1 diphosphomevalonate decarboxylase [Halorutilus salinus]